MNIFEIMEAEAKRNTVYNCIHVSMVNAELDNLRKIDRMENCMTLYITEGKYTYFSGNLSVKK